MKQTVFENVEISGIFPSGAPNGTYFIVLVISVVDVYNNYEMLVHAAKNLGTHTFESVPTRITHQPKNITACIGEFANFDVKTEGAHLSYQWYKDGIPIDKKTYSYLPFWPVKASDAGNYMVTVTDLAMSFDSAVAKLTVDVPKITSDLTTVTLKQGRLITNYTITTNFVTNSFSAKNLPTGLMLNANTGVVSGTPTRKGSFAVTFTAAKEADAKVIRSATGKKVFNVN